MRKSHLVIETIIIIHLLFTIWNCAHAQTDSLSTLKTSFMFGRWKTDPSMMEKSDGSAPGTNNDVYIIHRDAGFDTHTDGSSATGDSMIWESGLIGNAPSLSSDITLGDSVLQFWKSNNEVIAWDLDGDGNATESDTLWKFLEDTSRYYFVNFLMKVRTPASGSKPLFVSRNMNWGVFGWPGIRIYISSVNVYCRNSNGSSWLAMVTATDVVNTLELWHSISFWNDKDSLHLSVDGVDFSKEWASGDYSAANLSPKIPDDLGGGTYHDFKFREITIWKDYVLTDCERKLLQHYQNIMYGLSIPGSDLADIESCLPTSESGYNNDNNVRRRGLRR